MIDVKAEFGDKTTLVSRLYAGIAKFYQAGDQKDGSYLDNALREFEGSIESASLDQLYLKGMQILQNFKIIKGVE